MSLVFNDGQPYVAYQDTSSGTDSATVIFYNSTSQWEALGNTGFTPGLAIGTSLAFSPVTHKVGGPSRPGRRRSGRRRRRCVVHTLTAAFSLLQAYVAFSDGTITNNPASVMVFS